MIEFDLKKIGNYIFIKDDEKLGDYANENVNFTKGLPNGILDKKYTGLGATWTEFNAPRKSILVFPFRRLAEEKAESYNNRPYPTFYVGTKKNGKSQYKREIVTWIKENKGKNLKFSVVADSIGKLVDALKEAKEEPFDNYFLVLDEVELLQMQSGFRSILPLCFDFFKKFKNKCLVSATLLSFSDENLANLDLYPVSRYNVKQVFDPEAEPTLETIILMRLNTKFPHIIIAQKIAEYFEKTKEVQNDHKFFIGINSLDAIKEFIDEFEKHNANTEISVLVSDASSDKFLNKYNQNRIEGKKLPSPINLTTCINWSGIDIEENFFSVAISLSSEVHHSFSFENLVQFFGRCRLKLENQFSKTFVIGTPCKLNYKAPEINADDRIFQLKAFLSYVSKEIKSPIDRGIIKSALLESKTPFFYKGVDGRIQVNWLLNDLEKYTANIAKDYNEFDSGLLKKLKERYLVETVETEDASFVDIQRKTYDEKLTEDLNALLDNFSEQYPEEKLVRYIREKSSPTTKIAAFWYLFGRRFLDDHSKALEVAKYYSGHEAVGVPSNNVINISKITMEGLRLYILEPSLYENLNKMLSDLSLDGTKSRNSSDYLSIFKTSPFLDYFPSIVKATYPVSMVTNFLKYFFGLEKSAGGGNKPLKFKFPKVTAPKIIQDYPELANAFKKVVKFPPMLEGVSLGKTSLQNILDESFKK